MPVSLEQFAENLIASGLFSAAELGAFQESLPPETRPRDAQGLARELNRAGKLTKYQAAQVYQEKTKGLVLGDYVILDEIGHGGMGQVFKAWHRTMERVVAIKELRHKRLQSPQAVERFRREVKTAARLMHPNIVTALDAGEHEGIYYLVMEYVEGRDLAHLLVERGPLPVDETVNYIIQTARGLEYAHRQGVVHRDIKPGNLLLDHEGTVKILDMGLARIEERVDPYAATAAESLTPSGHVMGTHHYMAPEQAEDARHADHRADIYSLGCTFYRLLTGQKPFTGDTPVQVLLAHREAPRPSIRTHRPDAPPELEGVVRKMMAKRPEDRYPSMTEVIAALEARVAAARTPSRVAVAGPPGRSGLPALPRQHDQHSVVAEEEALRAAEDTVPSQLEQETTRPFWKKVVSLTGGRMVKIVGFAGAVTGLLIAFGLLFALLPRRDEPRVLPIKPEPDRSAEQRRQPEEESGGRQYSNVPKQPDSQEPIDPRVAWAGDPDQRVTFTDPDLYHVIRQTVKDFPIEWFQRMLYTEVITTIERGQYGQWTLGGNMMRDGKPYAFTVQAGRWFVKVVSPEEAAEREISGGGFKRNIRDRWELPVQQLTTLQDPELRVVTSEDGTPTLTGRIRCVQDRRTPLTFLGLMVQIPVPGEDATRDIQQAIYSNDLSSGWIEVSTPIGSNVDLNYNIRFYLQAFLSRPDARFFRISNELLWIGNEPE